jgi:hypothetical protein
MISARAAAVTVAFTAAALLALSTAAADSVPVFVPIAQLATVPSVAGRRKILDEFAAWAKMNGLPVAGPSNEDAANLAIVCSDGPDGDEDCRVPLVALNSDATESATLFSFPRRLMFGEGGSITPELREQLDGWAKELRVAAEKGDAEARKTVRTAQANGHLAGILSLLYETHVVGNVSAWAPWIATLPTEAEIKQQFPLLVSKEVAECLDISGRRMWRAMRRELKAMQDLVKGFCGYVNRETIRRSPDAKNVDVSKITITEGSGCYFAPSRVNWAFAIAASRTHTVSNRFTPAMLPFVDLLPYHPRPNVAPGVVHYAGPTGEIDPDVGLITAPTEEHQPAAIDFIAGSALKADDPLSFRTRFFEPVEALLNFGYHRVEHFASGMPALIAWDTEAAESLDALNCTTDPNANRIRADGTFDDMMITCAEQHVTRGVDKAETAALRKQLVVGQVAEVTVGAHDFLSSHAALALQEIASKESKPRCYDANRGPVARAIADHNTETRRIFGLFAERVAERRAQKAEVQRAIDAAVKKANDEAGRKHDAAKAAEETTATPTEDL